MPIRYYYISPGIQSGSLRPGLLISLAAVAVGFLLPARQVAQPVSPSSPSTTHTRTLTKSRPGQAKLSSHPAGKTHQVAHRAAARSKSAGSKVASAKSAPAKPASRTTRAKLSSGQVGVKPGKKRVSSKKVQYSAVAAHRNYMAHLHPGRDRVTTIQEKLAEVGYLNEQPNGQWDEQTRQAMRRYQEDNGFPTTGLPEAKSLMKLGLGPHPLPPELDRPRTQAADAAPSGGGGR